jgi:hypothetical protein
MRLTANMVKEVILLKDEMITKELFIRWFGKTTKNLKVKFNPNDSFAVTKDMTPLRVDQAVPIITTVGRWIFNVFLNHSVFGTTFPYFNSQEAEDFHKEISYAFLEGVVTEKQHSLYQTKKAWLEYSHIELLVPGFSMNIITPNPQVIKYRDELFKKYEKELAAGDVVIAAKIEAELLAYAKKILANDPAMRLFSREKPSFKNNYKNMSVMLGSQKNNTDPSKFYISKSNFVDGINKEEFSSHADQLIYGTFQRSVNTAVGGALTKEMRAAYESEQVDIREDSDCGTQLYTTVTFTDKNIEYYLFHWVKSTKGLVQILPSNRKQFIGKTFKKRTSMYCNSEKYCSKCASGLWSKLHIEDAGLSISSIGSSIVNLSMKAFHNSTVNAKSIEWEKYFSD